MTRGGRSIWEICGRSIDVVIYNRCDHTVGRAAQLSVLLSEDGQAFERAYQHDGTVFLGQPDGKPLTVALDHKPARYLRIQVPGNNCLHLDEVEVFAAGSSDNVALGRPATQSSVCEWSTRKGSAPTNSYPTLLVVQQGLRLVGSLQRFAETNDAPQPAADQGRSYAEEIATLQQIQTAVEQLPADAPEPQRRELYLRARWTVRELSLTNPLLDFNDLVLVRGAPGKWSHMSDQYLGWWSQPGGGLYVLHDFKTDHPALQCLTDGFPPGNVLRPDISYDGQRVLFAWCRHYPGLSDWPDKLDKSRLPEDSFYHLFEVQIDGSGTAPADLRQVQRLRRPLPAQRRHLCSAPHAVARRSSAMSNRPPRHSRTLRCRNRMSGAAAGPSGRARCTRCM